MFTTDFLYFALQSSDVGPWANRATRSLLGSGFWNWDIGIWKSQLFRQRLSFPISHLPDFFQEVFTPLPGNHKPGRTIFAISFRQTLPEK